MNINRCVDVTHSIEDFILEEIERNIKTSDEYEKIMTFKPFKIKTVETQKNKFHFLSQSVELGE